MASVVLVADDEEPVRSILMLLLRQEGFSVLTACDGQEALKLSRESPDRIDLLITDVDMPGVKGIDLAARLLKERPGIKAILMTGDAKKVEHQDLPLLVKPFHVEALKSKVREVLAAP